ncbi:MAG: hypothetical protein PHP42_12270 [Bacteroidota bacterium]|nr:hypothetical protein [Bacteroidota bacterium]
MMTIEEKQQTLKKIFWEYDFSGEELQALLQGKISRAGHLDKEGLYLRLLSSLTWYVILDLIGTNHLDDLLSDGVLSRLHSKDLQKKYAIAKRVLFH